MKHMKILAMTSLVAALALVAHAAPRLDDSIKELNAEAERVLTPYINANTKAKVTFVKITTNKDRVLEARVTGAFSKVGAKNSFSVNISDVSYVYGNGSAPVSRVKASAAVDLTKSLTQDQINETVPQLVAMIESAAKENLKDFGDAVTVDAKIIEEKKDSKGNYLSVRGEVTGVVDLAKLPPGKKVQDVPVVKTNIKIFVDLKKGIELEATATSNGKYFRFLPGASDSMTELLQKFLARDPEQTKKLDDAIKFINDFAANLVD